MLIRQLVCVQKGMGEVRMAMEGDYKPQMKHNKLKST